MQQKIKKCKLNSQADDYPSLQFGSVLVKN